MWIFFNLFPHPVTWRPKKGTSTKVADMLIITLSSNIVPSETFLAALKAFKLKISKNVKVHKGDLKATYVSVYDS